MLILQFVVVVQSVLLFLLCIEDCFFTAVKMVSCLLLLSMQLHGLWEFKVQSHDDIGECIALHLLFVFFIWGTPA